MAESFLSKKLISSLLTPIVRSWGRFADRYTSYTGTDLPQTNPDSTLESTYYDIAHIPYMVAGREARDISHLFVSARGLTPEKNNAASPPQLIFTTPDIGDQQVLESLAYQYDEGFDCHFGSILRSLETPVFQQGRCIAEIEWYRREQNPFKDMIFARYVWSRDPDEYVFDYEGEPGIYKYVGYAKYERMDDLRYMSYAYSPLYNNPYGESINLSIKNMADTWIKVYGYWRHALEKAGLGSWLGKYKADMAGIGAEKVAKRIEFIQRLQDIASGTVSIVPESTSVEAIKMQFEAQAFLDFHNAFVQTVSLLYTGSATALSEGKYGTYASKESTDVREKAAREHMDALRVNSFWTYEFNRRFCAINFSPNRLLIYPALQLISPELIFPTTPEGQETESIPEEHEIQQRPEEQAEEPPQEEEIEEEPTEMMAELQEEEPRPPAEVPGTYHRFPDEEPEPEEYAKIIGLAENILRNEIIARPYTETTPENAANTFTVKQLRGFSQVSGLLEDLKLAIIPTLSAGSEAQAWSQYYLSAVKILPNHELKMTPMLRNDLVISFRQARQTALERAILQDARQDPTIAALRLQSREDDRVRHVHNLWNGVTLDKNDVLWDNELNTPMDFGCRCRRIAVPYNELQQYPITPVSELPETLPGETYRMYAVQ